MALIGSINLPKTAVKLPMHFSKLQKPTTMIMIRCGTPDRPKTSSGSGEKINRTLRVSTRTVSGVKEVTPNTTLDLGEDNQKSKAIAVDDNAATVNGAETNI
ncbi:hypothetical protein PTKIN_Ptkin19aG0014200 [Pterospermum kingtungense]